MALISFLIYLSNYCLPYKVVVHPIDHVIQNIKIGNKLLSNESIYY